MAKGTIIIFWEVAGGGGLKKKKGGKSSITPTKRGVRKSFSHAKGASKITG